MATEKGAAARKVRKKAMRKRGRTLAAAVLSVCLAFTSTVAWAQYASASGSVEAASSAASSQPAREGAAVGGGKLAALGAANSGSDASSTADSAAGTAGTADASAAADGAADAAAATGALAPAGDAGDGATSADDASGDSESAPAAAAGDGSASPDPADPAASAGEGSPRPAEAFAADDYIANFALTIESNGVSKTYNLANGQSIDATADFPGGLARSATYAGDITIAVRELAEHEGKYPLVPGDTLTCAFPSILRPNSTSTGRLRDASAAWDHARNGVGDYIISNGTLTISYDDGYLEEKSGKVLTSSIKFSGSFDTSTQTNDEFDINLMFGSINLGVRFSKLEIVRNLSIEKTGAIIANGPYIHASYPRAGSADVDADGCVTYTVKVTAGDDNTQTLTHVKVTDVFDENSQDKVDLSSMKLMSATVDGESIMARTVALRDSGGNVNGWDIGSLPAGQTAVLVYKVKLDKEALTEAVRAAKDTAPSSSVVEARRLTNTASASADEVPAVSDDFSMVVKNYLSVRKAASSYDWKTQTEHFTITVNAPSDNRYTEYNVPITDRLSSDPGASCFAASGIESMSVRHVDGSQEDLAWSGFAQPDTRSWHAVIPELRPGDVVTIKSCTTLADSFWDQSVGNGVGGDTYMENHVSVGSGLKVNGVYANDLNAAGAYASFNLSKSWLWKSSPSIGADGTVAWTIVGNQQGTNATPRNAAGQVVVDELGPNQAFAGGEARVVFYNQDGSVAGEDAIPLKGGATSFRYTIPEQYGTCGFRITYMSKITDWDSYVGPSKTYTNRVSGLWSWASTGTTGTRPRVPSMSKTFVEQADDWARWQTSIYSALESGDVYTDAVRNANYLYFTQDDLDGVALTLDGVAVDPALYEIAPAGDAQDGRYGSFTVTFKGKVSVVKDGETITPSKDAPLVISYTTKVVNPSFGTVFDYYNDATLTSGSFKDTDYDYCRRANRVELRKSVKSSSNGYISWLVQANYYGYSGQPDGTCAVTDVLPAGVEFVSATKVSGSGSLETQNVTENEDGTTTIALKLSGLKHDEVSKNHPSDGNGGYEFHFIVKARITDEDYLYGTESRDFSFTNTVSLVDRYGIPKSASASTNIHHTAIKKTMAYNETTAPYARFSVELNREKIDLNPDGDTVSVVDVSTDSLAVDPESFEVVNATTGDPVPFEIDASRMDENRVTVAVPDGMFVKVTYAAQVLGVTGKPVVVGNSAFFEGHETHKGESTISETVQVLKATGVAVSEPMIWLSKRDESARPLAGAVYALYAYDEARGWSLVRDAIATTDDGAARGVKVESLELGVLYKLVETAAPAGYVKAKLPQYFVLYGDEDVSVTYPTGVAEDKVFKGPSGSLVTAYNMPYTNVRFAKMSDDGVQLAGARLEVRDAGGNVVRDQSGARVEMTTSATEANEFVLAPGSYTLVETEAPAGYDSAEAVPFTVTGDKERTVLEGGEPVSVVTVADASALTSLTVRKEWRDADDRDGARPGQVRVRLLADGVPVEGSEAELTAAGPDGTAGTDDDWTAVFEGLSVMRAGEKVAYGVEELDVADGYAASNAERDGSIVVTNTRTFDPVSVTVRKTWYDDGDRAGARPDRVTVHLLADGVDTGQAVDVTAAGPDGAAGTDDDWTAVFADLAAVADDRAISYTVREDMPAGYREAAPPQQVEGGFVLANAYDPAAVPPAPGPQEPDDVPGNGADASRDADALPQTGDVLPFAAGAAAALAPGAAVVLVAARKRR